MKLQLAITQTPRWLAVIGKTARAHTVKQHLEYDMCDAIGGIDFAWNCAAGQVEIDIRK